MGVKRASTKISRRKRKSNHEFNGSELKTVLKIKSSTKNLCRFTVDYILHIASVHMMFCLQRSFIPIIFSMPIL